MRMLPIPPTRAALLFAVALAVCWPGRVLAAPDKKDKTKEPEPPKRTLLLFPFDFTGASIGNAADVTQLLTDVARSRLLASHMYSVIQFYRSLPPVARLHNEQQLTDSDIAPPFAEDNAKAIKIAKLTDFDVVFVGSVDSYDYSDANKQTDITASGRLIEVATGKIIKSATLGASSAKGGSAKEEERAMEAARTAGDKLMAQLVPVIAPTETPPGEKPKGKKPSQGGKRR